MSFRQWILPLSAASVAGLTYYERFVREHVYTFQYHKHEDKSLYSGSFCVRGVLNQEIMEGIEHETDSTIIKLKRVD